MRTVFSDPVGWLSGAVGTPERYRRSRNLTFLFGVIFSAVILFNIEISARIGVPRWGVHFLVLAVIAFLSTQVSCLLKASSEALKEANHSNH